MKLQELLVEEANTSLMYHKLFPNKTKIRTLEDLGFEFKMGSGTKILKRHLSRSSRSRGAHKHRTLQTITILYRKRFFRSFTKAEWVMLVDPTDQHSQTKGDVFLDKLIAHFGNLRDQEQQRLGISKL